MQDTEDFQDGTLPVDPALTARRVPTGVEEVSSAPESPITTPHVPPTRAEVLSALQGVPTPILPRPVQKMSNEELLELFRVFYDRSPLGLRLDPGHDQSSSSGAARVHTENPPDYLTPPSIITNSREQTTIVCNVSIFWGSVCIHQNGKLGRSPN